MLIFSNCIDTKIRSVEQNPTRIKQIKSECFLARGNKMNISKRRMPQEKVRIVLEFLNIGTSAAELCRKHNISPVTFQDWKNKFMADGKQALAGPRETAKIHTKEQLAQK